MLRVGNFSPQLKLLFHTDRINKWLAGNPIYPILVEFDLSNKCNHRCDFCTFNYVKDRSTLDGGIAKRSVEEFAKGGVKAINWTGGGEPLLHKDFSEIARLTHSFGIDQGIFTNGALLNDDIIDALLDTHSWVRISMDAATREMYKGIRKVDDFDRVVSNIRKLVSAKKRKGSQTTIGIGFIITPNNHMEIRQFSELIKVLDVDYGQYKPCIMRFNDKEQLSASWWKLEVKPVLEEVFDNNKKAVVNLYKLTDLIESSFDKSYDKCYGHMFCPCIGASGDVWLCTHLRGLPKYSMGNLYENTFDEIWNGERRKEVIKEIDFNLCQFCCKNNEINKILYQIKHPDKKAHYNFL
jgi:cyclic pyranopterin phosphate synthase